MSNIDNTNSNIERLIKIEKERYERLLHLIETKKTNDTFSNNLGILVRLMPNEYRRYVDLYNSYFSLKKYNIDDSVYAYDYEVSFDNEKELHRSIILTYLNLSKLYDDLFKIGTKNIKDLKFTVDKDVLTNKIIEKTFSHRNPYITYSISKAKPESLMMLPDSQHLVKYYAKDSNLACEMDFNNEEDPIRIYTDFDYSKDYVFPWVAKNISEDDDPTKLVEMAGYYATSEKLHNLVKRI